MRIHWGVQGVIHLKEDDDQRTVVTVRKRNSCRFLSNTDNDSDDDLDDISRDNSFNNLSITSTNSTLDLENSISSLNLDNICTFESGIESGGDASDISSTVDSSPLSPGPDISSKSSTLPPKLNLKTMKWDELDDLLQVERKVDESNKLYQTMPLPLPSQSSENSSVKSSLDQQGCVNEESAEDSQITKVNQLTEENILKDLESAVKENVITDEAWLEMSNHLNRSMSGPDCLERIRNTKSPEFDQISINSTNTDISSFTQQEGVVVRRPPKTGSTAIKRRPGKRLSRTKIKRRCSINGHFYNRETSFFTPPHGSQMSVWITSLVNTQEVVNLILEKYKVESDASNFALFVVRDNGGKIMITIT